MTEEQELVLKIIGEQQLKELNVQFEKEKELIQQATTNFKNLAITQAQYEQVVAASVPRLMQLNAEMKALNQEAKSFSGNSGLQLSYVIDDLANTSGNWQRHLASISNNMPGLLMSMGVGTGLAGQLAMVYTGFVVVLPVLKQFFDMITGGSEEARKNMEALKKATDDAAESFDKLVEKPGKAEEASQKAIAEKLQGPGGRAVQDALISSMTARGTGEPATSEEDIPQWLRMYAKIDPVGAAGMRDANKALIAQNAQERIKKGNLQRAQAVLGGFQAGATQQERNEALMTLQGHMQANPQMFPADFQISNLTPEAFGQQQALEAQGKGEAHEATQRLREMHVAEQRAKEKAKNIAEGEAAEGDLRADAVQEKDRQAKKAITDAAAAKRKNQAAARHGVVQGKRDAVAARHLGEQQQLTSYSDWFEGQGASSEQALAMAHDTVAGMKQGLSLSQASFEAWMSMQREVQKINMQMQQMQGAWQGQMGANNRQFGGQNFSFQSPMPGQ